MANLSIYCELSQSQMDEIVQEVMKYVRNTDVDDLMFDTEVCGYRVYVEFYIGLNNISIKDAEIQGSQYSLTRDSFVLTCNLEDEMIGYNQEQQSSKIQALDIFQDQQESILNYAI